jgi:hypothetical protein
LERFKFAWSSCVSTEYRVYSLEAKFEGTYEVPIVSGLMYNTLSISICTEYPGTYLVTYVQYRVRSMINTIVRRGQGWQNRIRTSSHCETNPARSHSSRSVILSELYEITTVIGFALRPFYSSKVAGVDD